MQCQHALERGTLASMESEKCETYRSDNHTQGHAFAPLVSNSFGQLGPEFLRLLWALADYAARNLVPVPLPALPVLGPPPADSGDDNSPLDLKARLEILLAVYEGISERIVGSTRALQNNRQFWFKIKDISAFWSPEHDWEAGAPPPGAMTPEESDRCLRLPGRDMGLTMAQAEVA